MRCGFSLSASFLLVNAIVAKMGADVRSQPIEERRIEPLEVEIEVRQTRAFAIRYRESFEVFGTLSLNDCILARRLKSSTFGGS